MLVQLKKIAFVLTVGLYPLFLFSQDLVTLEKNLKNAQSPDAKALASIELGYAQKLSNPTKAHLLGNQALQLASNAGNKELLGKAYGLVGHMAYLENKIDSSIYFHQKAALLLSESTDSFEISRNHNRLGAALFMKENLKEAMNEYKLAIEWANDPKIKANALNNMGMTSKQIGDFTRAIVYHNQALAYYELLNDQSFLAKTYTNLGSCFWLKKDDTKAAEAYWNSFQISKNLNIPDIHAQALSGLGLLAGKSGLYDSAIASFSQSANLFKAAGFQREYAQQLVNLADNQTQSGLDANAEKNYQEALKLFVAISDIQGQTAVYNNFSNLYEKKKDWKKAAEYLEIGYSLAGENKLPQYQLTLARNLSFVYEKAGNATKALEYRKQYDELKEEWTDLAENIKYIEVDHQLQVSKKEKELLESQEKITSMKTSMYWIYAGVLLLLATLFVISRALNRRKRKQLELEANISSIEKQILDVKSENTQLRSQLLQTEFELQELSKKYQGQKKKLPSEVVPLSKREHEVLLYLAEGLADKEIAEKLFVSINTVRTHTRRIYDKLLVNNRMEAVKMLNTYNLLPDNQE